MILFTDLPFGVAVGLGICIFIIIFGMLIVKEIHDKFKL